VFYPIDASSQNILSPAVYNGLEWLLTVFPMNITARTLALLLEALHMQFGNKPNFH
jgi:hypothetical protein